jgi:hypothetical protein
MHRHRAVIAGFIIMLLPAAMAPLSSAASAPAYDGYAGFRSCMTCHERFCQFLSDSFHGLAMQLVESIARGTVQLQPEFAGPLRPGLRRSGDCVLSGKADVFAMYRRWLKRGAVSPHDTKPI